MDIKEINEELVDLEIKRLRYRELMFDGIDFSDTINVINKQIAVLKAKKEHQSKEK